MKLFFCILAGVVIGIQSVSALTINEIFSNPIGDDGGREWVELYNDSDSLVDISSLTIAIKGGNPVIATPVSGGTIIPPYGYAIVGSTVSSATRFLQDYPEYSGVLFKSSIGLVNTGVTSIDIRLGGLVVDSVSSYTAAKEGKSYAKINGQFLTTVPSPGKENTIDDIGGAADPQSTTTPTVGVQTTIPQMSPPSADIVLYLPFEKVVVAGAPTEFSIYALTNSGKPIQDIVYGWSFGDGGYSTGSTTVYRYMHPGVYIVYVDGSNGTLAGKARMKVKVVNPDIEISEVKTSKHGSYIEITNPNSYELDISGWKISIDGALHSLPFTTVLLPGTTRFSGQALGFSSLSGTSTSLVKLLFGDMSEVTRNIQVESVPSVATSTVVTPVFVNSTINNNTQKTVSLSAKKIKEEVVKTKKPLSATTTQETKNMVQKDTRIAQFIKSLFR